MKNIINRKKLTSRIKRKKFLRDLGSHKKSSFLSGQSTKTLILILGYVVLNKMYLIFQRLKIKKIHQKKIIFSLSGQPLTPCPTLY